MHTGFRSSELKSLRWSHVDMVHRSITVESCYSKNGETGTVPMTMEVFTEFDQMRRDRDRAPHDIVFVSRYGKPWKNWRTAFENACERAGITDFRFHDLRHCYGSWLAMSGTTGKAAMELMLQLIVEDKSLSQVATELNQNGFRNRSGEAWTQTMMFNLLPRLIEVAPDIRIPESQPI